MLASSLSHSSLSVSHESEVSFFLSFSVSFPESTLRCVCATLILLELIFSSCDLPESDSANMLTHDLAER